MPRVDGSNPLPHALRLCREPDPENHLELSPAPDKRQPPTHQWMRVPLFLIPESPGATPCTRVEDASEISKRQHDPHLSMMPSRRPLPPPRPPPPRSSSPCKAKTGKPLWPHDRSALVMLSTVSMI